MSKTDASIPTEENNTVSGLLDYVSLLRPTQWVKNVVVFTGPAAGLKLMSPGSFLSALATFGAFCLVASASYAINDVLDRKADASHPTKKDRPVARGAITSFAALSISVVLLAGGVTLAVLTCPVAVTLVLLAYFVMTMTYSLVLKKRLIIDVIVIATGFVFRAWAGSLAVGVMTSEWLVACMFTLCLFMGFGKRRCELAMIGNATEAGEHRQTLLRYTPQLLNHLITVSAGIAVMTFLLYTTDTSHSPAPFHKEHLFFTLPLVVYGIFRFAMLSELGLHSGPTEIVLRDRPLMATIAAWTLTALMIAYQTQLFGPAGIPGLWQGD